MKALCFGSLNIDYTYKVDHFVRKGETTASSKLDIFSGGKGLNQAVALSRAGAETYHAGAIGEEGVLLAEQLKGSGVDTSFIKVLPDVRTGHAIIQNDKEGDNCILLFGGANRAVTREQADETLSRFGEGDYLILQNEISEIPYIIEQGHKRGMKVVFNPSPMDDAIPDYPLEMVDIFLVNEGEAAAILGDETVPEEDLARKMSERFPNAMTVVTLGAKGSVYRRGDKEIVQPPYPAEVVDTTAAGDTFTGFFISALMDGKTEEEAMDMASRASSVAVTRLGASPSIPTYEEVINHKF